MFISNKEKSDISENIARNKSQIENVVKHVAKLQVDIAKTEVDAIDDLLKKHLQLQKMYWGSDKKVKTLEKRVDYLERTIDTFENTLNTLEKNPKTVHTLEKTVTVLEGTVNSLQVSNELLLRKSKSLTEMLVDFNKKLEKLEAKKAGRPAGAKNKVVIPAEKVQEMKDSGAWDDPKLRIFSIDKFIKDEREIKEQRKIEKQRESGRRYYAKKKAEKAAQKELL